MRVLLFRLGHSSRSGYDGGRRSGAGGSHGLYVRNTSNMGYRRGTDIMCYEACG